MPSFLSKKKLSGFCDSEITPFRDRELFRMTPRGHVQALTLAHTIKVQGVMQMRQTRQMQMNEDACLRNSTHKTATPETRNSSAGPVIFKVTYSKTWWEFVGPRKMVRLNWFVRQKVLRANIHETEGLPERNIAVIPVAPASMGYALSVLIRNSTLKGMPGWRAWIWSTVHALKEWQRYRFESRDFIAKFFPSLQIIHCRVALGKIQLEGEGSTCL